MEKYFEYLNTHCDSCGAELTKEGRCPKKRWWIIFHRVFRDVSWTY